MRKVVAGLYLSLDGVTEAPETWQFDHFDPEMMAGLAASIAREDAVLLGRVTYEQWAAYWPSSHAEPYASHINTIAKYVVSTTLQEVSWQNSYLINGPLVKEINRLKQEPGGVIGVAGSATLVHSLLMNDLIDELTLMILPVIAGRGRRLFSGDSQLKRLELIQALTTSSGVAVLTYQPKSVAALPQEPVPAGSQAGVG